MINFKGVCINTRVYKLCYTSFSNYQQKIKIIDGFHSMQVKVFDVCLFLVISLIDFFKDNFQSIYHFPKSTYRFFFFLGEGILY